MPAELLLFADQTLLHPLAPDRLFVQAGAVVDDLDDDAVAGVNRRQADRSLAFFPRLFAFPRVLVRGPGYFFRSSISTCFATAFSVSKTPTPVGAVASKVGSPL